MSYIVSEGKQIGTFAGKKKQKKKKKKKMEQDSNQKPSLINQPISGLSNANPSSIG